MEQLLCPWESAQYFVYSSNIPTLFFYSHIPAMLVALLAGLLVFFKSGKSRTGITMLSISILFILWSFFDLILWSTNRPDVVIFFWSLQILLEPLVYLLSLFLVYFFVKGEDVSFKWKLAGILLYSPIVFFLFSSQNLSGVDLAYCIATEGFVAQYYTYIVETIFILSIIIFTLFEFRKNPGSAKRKEIAIFSVGVVLFLLAFSSGNVIGSFTENWTLAQAGLIGMPIFVGFLAYMIVRFHTFNIKLIATQVLMATIWLLVLGILLVRNIENVTVVTALTLILVTVAGDLLIKSVIKEVKQREELARLNVELQDLIQQRESLVHLIDHKVKGSFTRSKYIFAGMLDGTFGPISEEVKKRAEQGIESNDAGIKTIDLVLNVANLQKGGFKYDLKEVDFKSIVLESVKEKRVQVEEKGLLFVVDIKDGDYKTQGDPFWLKEVVSNFIDNAGKYTREGSVTVRLGRFENKIKLLVLDTGLGLSEEDKRVLFTEGGRGKDAIKVNVDSTGYGLYSVKLIVEAHKGRVWAESEGPGRGSTFFLELNAI